MNGSYVAGCYIALTHYPSIKCSTFKLKRDAPRFKSFSWKVWFLCREALIIPIKHEWEVPEPVENKEHRVLNSPLILCSFCNKDGSHTLMFSAMDCVRCLCNFTPLSWILIVSTPVWVTDKAFSRRCLWGD